MSNAQLPLGRFVTGLGVGSLSMAVPLYKYVIFLLLCIYLTHLFIF